MHPHLSKSRAFRHFVQHTPRKPRAADSYTNGVHILPKRAALECGHIQLQPAEMRASIAADLDTPDAYTRLRELDYPPAQLLMRNPENGHIHPIWQIRDAVPFTEDARRPPQRAFMDLQRQITLMAGGDAGYSHYLVKTPGHARWETIVNDIPPYSMAELLDAIPAGIAAQSRQRKAQVAHGEGRHQTLFDIGRKWAYGEVGRHKRRGGNAQTWADRVRAEFLNLNAFALPLSVNQVHSLARNVARWTWENADRLNGSVLDGEKRSLVKSWQREEITDEQAKERMSQGARYANAVRRNKTVDAITDAIGQLIAQGIHSPSAAQVAALAGVSSRTVERFRASQGQSGQGN